MSVQKVKFVIYYTCYGDGDPINGVLKKSVSVPYPFPREISISDIPDDAKFQKEESDYLSRIGFIC